MFIIIDYWYHIAISTLILESNIASDVLQVLCTYVLTRESLDTDFFTQFRRINYENLHFFSSDLNYCIAMRMWERMMYLIRLTNYGLIVYEACWQKYVVEQFFAAQHFECVRSFYRLSQGSKVLRIFPSSLRLFALE